jgi:hypothetical protein
MWQYRKVTFPSYSAPVSSCIQYNMCAKIKLFSLISTNWYLKLTQEIQSQQRKKFDSATLSVTGLNSTLLCRQYNPFIDNRWPTKSIDEFLVEKSNSRRLCPTLIGGSTYCIHVKPKCPPYFTTCQTPQNSLPLLLYNISLLFHLWTMKSAHIFCKFFIQHCFFCRPLDSNVSQHA